MIWYQIVPSRQNLKPTREIGQVQAVAWCLLELLNWKMMIRLAIYYKIGVLLIKFIILKVT